MKRRRWLIIAGVLIVLCIMFYILLLRYFYFNKYNIHAPKAIIWRLNNVYGQEFVLDTINFQVRENTEEGPSYVYTWTFTLHDEEGTEFHAYLWLFGSHQYGEGMSYELDYGAAKMSDDYGQLVIEKRLGEQIDFDQYRRLKSTENPDEPDYLFVYKENNAQEIAEILTKIYFEEQQYTQGVGLRCKVTDEEGEELYSYTCWDVANHLEDEEITEETVYKYIYQEINVIEEEISAQNSENDNTGGEENGYIREDKTELGGYSIIYPSWMMSWLENHDEKNMLSDYGLEIYPELSENYYFSDLELKEQEQIIMLEIYDYDISPYIEETILTINKEGRVYKYNLLIDREDGLLECYQEDMDYYTNDIELLKDEMDDVIRQQRTTARAGVDYFLPLSVQDTNGDGKQSEVLTQEVISEKEKSGKEYYGELIGVDWTCNYIQLEDIPHEDSINKQIESEIDYNLEKLLAFCSEYERDDIEVTGVDKKAWILVEVFGNEIIYQSDRFLAIGIASLFRPLWDGSLQYNYKYQIICFDLEEGKTIKLEDITDKEYTEQDLKELVWVAYEEKIKTVADKYTRECFENYYKELFDDAKYWYMGNKQNNGYIEKALDEYIHYYFDEEGMVFYFNRDWEGMPAEYFLDENLGTETEMRITVPYEKIADGL